MEQIGGNYCNILKFAEFFRYLLAIGFDHPSIIACSWLYNSRTKYRRLVMATNPPSGDGHRNGAVKNRSQVFNPKTEQWVKRDKDSGRFMDVKQDGTPFKGVRKEK